MTKLSDCCGAEVTDKLELAGITYYCPACGKPCDTIQTDKRVGIEQELVKIVTEIHYGKWSGNSIRDYVGKIQTLFTPEAREIREKMAEWLFTNKHRLPDQMFYHNWHTEIAASPLTEKIYRNLANEVFTLLQPLIERARKEEREKLEAEHMAEVESIFQEIEKRSEVFMQSALDPRVREIKEEVYKMVKKNFLQNRGK